MVMRSKSLVSILLKLSLFICCALPYGFWAMNADISTGSMLFHYMMCLAVLLSFIIAIKTKNVIILLIGNLLSFILSFYFVSFHQNYQWEYYFKPFSPLGFLKFISTIYIGIQLIALCILQMKRRKREC